MAAKGPKAQTDLHPSLNNSSLKGPYLNSINLFILKSVNTNADKFLKKLLQSRNVATIFKEIKACCGTRIDFI